MSRSVSVPADAERVTYLWADDYMSILDQWDDFVEMIVWRIKDASPTTTAASRWIGREDRIIAENGLVAFGISEYMGLVALWAVIPEHVLSPALAKSWLDRVWHSIEAKFPLRLRRVGVFSNGEAVYEREES